MVIKVLIPSLNQLGLKSSKVFSSCAFTCGSSSAVITRISEAAEEVKHVEYLQQNSEQCHLLDCHLG